MILKESAPEAYQSVILPHRECKRWTRAFSSGISQSIFRRHTYRKENTELTVTNQIYIKCGQHLQWSSSARHRRAAWFLHDLSLQSSVPSVQYLVLHPCHEHSIVPPHSSSGIHGLLIRLTIPDLPRFCLMAMLKNSLPLLFPPSLHFPLPSPQEGQPTIDARGKQATLLPGLVETERTH